mmetsp:Transcript_9067/g.32187  ORF Transcript_9067/g.32187 Transcript_9067/m.32187 type:complete len:88 (+) Transcript_9067:121-384(+)
MRCMCRRRDPDGIRTVSTSERPEGPDETVQADVHGERTLQENHRTSCCNDGSADQTCSVRGTELKRCRGFGRFQGPPGTHLLSSSRP